MSENNTTNPINIRKDFKACDERKIADFISAVEKSGVFKRKSYIPVNDSSHFERFNYVLDSNKISIVYDTKAKRLSITAKQEVLNRLESLYYHNSDIEIPKPEVQVQSTDEPKKLKISEKLKQQLKQLKSNNPVKLKRTHNKNAQDQKSAQAAANSAQSTVNTAVPGQPEYKNGFSFRNYTKEKFDEIYKRARGLKGIVLSSSAELVGKPDELIVVEVTDTQNQKVFLRYMPRKKSLTLQGKRSSLFTDIQMLLTGESDYNSAISSHIKLSGEEQKTGEVERRLKKLVPSAFEFLSEQSKIDLTIGLIDIYNKETKLSDYSVLLVPPYRGLERLIFDLQAAEGIKVKMIGQGFEKREDGSYCLKSGYRKKINSVIYNEVLSALYTEYFKERHNFTHSDNSDISSARVIRDIQEAQNKFDNLLQTIDYNCKKLKEIGFSSAK